MNNTAALYIHIPFCIKKCTYCDFFSYETDRNPWLNIDNYVNHLLEEIPKQQIFKLSTIFFGGGTPSLLEGHHVQKILDAVRAHFEVGPEAEISLEANPETLIEPECGIEKLRQYLQAGVNRISLGCQSFDENVLSYLGRVHDAEANNIAFRNIREAGFENVNIDLIFAVPGQAITSWQDTLQKAVQLGPEHIALYNLTIDHGSRPLLQDDMLDLAMYRSARSFLKKAGYTHYEISNFAKPGYECRHNLTYWHNEPYLGLGEGAISSTVTHDPVMTVILGLRMLREGVNYARFKERHQTGIMEVFGKQIEELVKLKMLKKGFRAITLTSRGLEVANQVFERFI
ncbi:MAG: radical SAM family heme chaperone HemW [Candidatus Margulisiibacteriota bacterium]